MGRSSDKWGTLSYEKCLKILNGKDKRHLCNGNTDLVQTDEGPAVRLWNTNILTFQKDGTVTLRSGIWETVTTRNRINRYCPYGGIGTFQKRWVFYHKNKHRYWFDDGMVISPTRCIDGRMVELDRFEKITGIPVKSLHLMRKAVASLGFDMLSRLYKKEEFKRDIICNAPKAFLPTLIGIVPNNFLAAFENRLGN